MFFNRPPSNGFGFGTNFNQDPFGNSLVAETRPRPRPQPVMMNTGYPVLDLIAGLGQVFNREPMTTPPYIPPQQSSDWGMGQNDNGSILSGGIFGPMVIEENPQPKPRPQYDIWGNPITRYPMDERPDPVDPGFYIKDKPSDGFFARPWRDDTEQQDWLNRWDIQPANDARYLPDYPTPDDTGIGAQIRRDWHDSYKDFAKNTIGQHAPMFAEQMPQPQPQQSYGDFMGEIKSVANNMVNNAASTFGSGLGQALSFIPGLGPIMELIGQGANIASTVAGATGLGGEKASSILNLASSFANGAAGGAATSSGIEEFGPPMPTEGGMFSGLRPNQQPSPTTPTNPTFKPQPAPAVSDGEGSWFKPLDQMIAEINERQARGEIFDDKTNSWVKPVTGAPDPQKSVVFKQPVPTDQNSPLPEAIQRQMNDRFEGMQKAKEFVKEWEKPSSDIYFAGGDSGVTYGYGRDMRYATPDMIKKELMGQGVDETTAGKISLGAGKYGADAKKFVEDNKGLLNLSEEQQDAILQKHLPRSDELMRKHLTQEAYDRLNPNQYAAIASIAYNTEESLKGDAGNRAKKTNTYLKNALNAPNLDSDEVERALKMWNRSGNQVMNGLVRRRQSESDLFKKPPLRK